MSHIDEIIRHKFKTISGEDLNNNDLYLNKLYQDDREYLRLFMLFRG